MSTFRNRLQPSTNSAGKLAFEDTLSIRPLWINEDRDDKAAPIPLR